jgi:hypothetical protein
VHFSRHASLSTDLSEIECRFDIDLEVVAAKMSGLGFAAAALWVLVENRLDGIGESRRRNRRQHGEARWILRFVSFLVEAMLSWSHAGQLVVHDG